MHRMEQQCEVLAWARQAVAWIVLSTSMFGGLAPLASEPPAEVSSKMDVRTFLAKPPPIRRMVFAKDAGGMTHNGKRQSGFLYYEAGWQPETFYVRHMTNTSDKLNAIAQRQIVGKTSLGLAWAINWMLPQGVVLTSPADEMNSRSKSLGAKHAHDGWLTLSEFRNLGMWLLQPGSLVWVDETQFEATAELASTVRREDPRTGKLSGRIVRFDTQHRPSRIEFSTPLNLGLKAPKFAVEYGYTKTVGETDLPNQVIVVREFDVPGLLGGHVVDRVTNLIEQVELGRFTEDKEGYTPGLFLPYSTNKAKPLVAFSTNGFNFQVTDQGLVAAGSKPVSKPKGSPLRIIPIWIGFGAIAVICLGLALRRAKHVK